MPRFNLSPNAPPFASPASPIFQESASAPRWRPSGLIRFSNVHRLTSQSDISANPTTNEKKYDKVIIGYPLNTTTGTYNLNQPFYGPSEAGIDLWVSYRRKLTKRIDWKIQLNIRNAFAKDGLIPISIEPDGHTWASVRVKPVQEWAVTNTLAF